MKRILVAFAVLFFIFIPCFFVCAQENEYKDIYEYSGIEEIEKSLDESTKSFFEGENIDITDYNWTDNLKTESIARHIISILRSGAKTPFKSGLCVVAIVLMAAAVRIYRKDNPTDTAIKFAITLSVLAVLFTGIWGSITAAVNAVKSGSAFMLSFVPVYMGILTVSGAPATAAASGGMLLAASEFIAAVAAFGQSALIGAYLALGVGSSVSPLLNKSGIADTFKKTGIWFLSLCSTVFLGVLGAKNAITTATDGITARTAKFILGTCVPVAGNALSGAVNAVGASMSVLKSSVGIYGVVAIAVMLLPILAEMLVWRLVLMVSGGICEIFGIDEACKLLKAIDGVFALLIGAILIVGATFIISLASVVNAGRGL